MATNFPSSLDSFTNPSGTDAMDSVTVPHATQHTNLNDAVEALQSKVGVDGSAVTSSLDYKVAQQGLTFIKSQTIGSGVSSVTVSDAFDSRFDNYCVTMNSAVSSSAGASLRVKVGSVATGYYGAMEDTQYTGTQSTSTSNNASDLTVGLISSVLGENAMTLYVYNPNITGQRTAFTSLGHGYNRAFRGGGQVTNTSAQTSLTILPAFTTMSGGTIRVYGYNNG